MSFIPSNLKSFVNKLESYSAQTVKMVPLAGRLDAGPRSQISVDLPPAAAVLPDTFTMWARLTTSGAGIAGANPTVLPPQHVESLLTSVQTSINSMQIDNGPGQLYGQLFNCISDITLGGKQPERAICQLGKDITSQLTTTGSAATVVNAATPNPIVPVFPGSTVAAGGVYDAPRARQIAISNWLGFLNASGGEVLDTDLCGATRITMSLADTNVLVTNELTTDPSTISYNLSNIFFTITVLSLSPEWYSTSALFLERGGKIERKLSLWWAYQGSVIPGSYAGQKGVATGTALTGGQATQTLNFSLGSQSIDLLIGTYLTVPDATRPFLCRYENNPQMVDYLTSTGRGSAFKRPGHIVQDYAFTVNNYQLPTFRVSRDEAFMHLLTQLGLAQDTIEGTKASIDSLEKWNESHWMCAFSLSAQAPADSRLISGFSSRGTNSNFSFDVTGNGVAPLFNCRPTCFVRTSSSLLISKNRMLELVT